TAGPLWIFFLSFFIDVETLAIASYKLRKSHSCLPESFRSSRCLAHPSFGTSQLNQNYLDDHFSTEETPSRSNRSRYFVASINSPTVSTSISLVRPRGFALRASM